MTRTLFLAFALTLWAAPAFASVTLCNQTSYILYAAVGYQSGPQAITQGWNRVVPGDCMEPKLQPPPGPFFFLSARSSRAHSGPSHVWGGSLRYCVKDTDFNLRTPLGAQSCGAEDAFLGEFSPVNTGNAANWTTTLTESPRIDSLEVARAIGIARLLNDLGYKIAPGGGKSNKSFDDALAKFRARMHLPANASTDDLFDALETEALKAAAPSGYTICNDGNGDIWAALAFQEGKDWLSRGWWKVAPGACARAIATPLATDKVWLWAEGRNHKPIVSGPDRFCIADVEFESHGRGACKQHGLSEAGFAATPTKGLTGFAAHVGNTGLLPPKPSPQAFTSK
ncbi:MAG TPA: DUF1036 domain-containing protein [Rhizomicrobium sp.]|nr:DUF1036 domain-containing protein [Rhizomicrobium sp.]